jgi:hypothetical protein
MSSFYKGLTLVLPFLRIVAAKATRKALHQQTVGLSRDDQLACCLIDGQLSGVLLNLALRQSGRSGDLLLRGARIFCFSSSTLALMRCSSCGRVLLGLRTHRGDLAIQLAQRSFDAAQPRMRASSVAVRASTRCFLDDGAAIAEGLRQVLISNQPTRIARTTKFAT